MTGTVDQRISNMDEQVALPRKNGELIFEAPWEARAFGLAVALNEQGVYPWSDFSQELAREIAAAESANDSSTYYELISARGIFIEGGDQYDYISTWKGTLVEDAIHIVFANGGAIGGTSAGLAVLGEIVFSARYGSAYPEETAYNPYDSYIQFEDDFLQILQPEGAFRPFKSFGQYFRQRTGGYNLCQISTQA